MAQEEKPISEPGISSRFTLYYTFDEENPNLIWPPRLR